MLTTAEIQSAANRLFTAEQTRVQTGLLFIAHPHMTIVDAYAVQAAFVDQRHARGRKTISRKIGLASKAMQSALNISEPDSGMVMDDMAFATETNISANRFIQPRIEVELTFILKSPLQGPGVTVADVLATTDYKTPALEILDTRILHADPASGKTRTTVDTISVNAANAGIITDGRAMRPDAFDPRWAGAIVIATARWKKLGLVQAC